MTERTRHVWVHVAFLPRECPGLVLEWRRRDGGGWEALVTYWREDESRALTDVVPAENLRPVREG
ncbi:hypothetical protein [Nocardioides sp.]|uniref:hypothetical protein n=1 Tax=Nocardioides sp. TaxID=35761 RepID=UPI003517A7C4